MKELRCALCLRPPQVLLPAQSGSPVDEARLNRALSDLDDTLDKLESMFLRRQPFLCGDDITVADLLAACELTQVSFWMLKPRPPQRSFLSLWVCSESLSPNSCSETETQTGNGDASPSK